MDTPWRRAYTAWLSFWFGTLEPHAQLALLRIGTALVLLYVLFVRSFDLETRFSAVAMSDPSVLRAIDPVAWPFSVFEWVNGPVWVWSVHVLAMVVATAFLLGVFTPVMAGLSLVFQLSYAHTNPAMLLGLDGLLAMALAYLTLAPSGRVLTVLPVAQPERPMRMSYHPERVWEPMTVTRVWHGFPVRLLQIHLCLIYFHSALSMLTTDWLPGEAFWHPRLVELGAPFAMATLLAHPWLVSLISYSLVLFELFYGVLVWLPRLRYVVLGTALVVHLAVGIAWGLLPFNLMMLVLNLAFVPPEHLQALLEKMRPLLIIPWITSD